MILGFLGTVESLLQALPPYEGTAHPRRGGEDQVVTTRKVLRRNRWQHRKPPPALQESKSLGERLRCFCRSRCQNVAHEDRELLLSGLRLAAGEST